VVQSQLSNNIVVLHMVSIRLIILSGPQNGGGHLGMLK